MILRKASPGLVVMVLCWLALSLPLVAQSPPQAASADETAIPSASVEEADQLIDRIREADSELAELIDQLPTVEGEQRDLLRARIKELATDQFGNLTTLTGMIADQEGQEDGISSLVQQEEQLVRQASRRQQTMIELLQQSLARDAEKRESLSPSELQVFENDMAERTRLLDTAFQAHVQLVQAMTSIEIEQQEQSEFLEQELEDRGKSLLQLVDLTRQKLIEYRRLAKTSPEDTDLQALVVATQTRYDANKTSLLATIQLMKRLDLKQTDLEVRALELTGELTPEALQLDVAVGLLKRSMQRFKTFLAERGPRLLFRFLLIVGILFAFWILSRITRWIARKVFEKTRSSSSRLLEQMVVATAGRLVVIVGIIVVLSQMGINPGPLLAGLGIAGFVVGFALQDTLANFAAGAMILAYRPYDVGDFIEAAGILGKVKDMNLVSTRILTVDNQTLIVPNNKIWGDVIRNVTAQTERRVDLVFGISYEDDVVEAERILAEIVAAHDKVLDDPEPVIKLHTLNDSSVDFVVRPWAKTDDYWDVYWDITREVKLRFDREGISIPYPQRDVHLIPVESSTTDTGETES